MTSNGDNGLNTKPARSDGGSDDRAIAARLLAAVNEISGLKGADLEAALARFFDDVFALRTANGDQISSNRADKIDRLLISVIKALPLDQCVEISTRLANDPRTPKTVAMSLACDSIDIASPILAGDLVFESTDLIEIVDRTGPDHRRRVAARPHLEAAVTDRLAFDEDDSVVFELVSNETAEIHQPALALIAERNDGNPVIQNALLDRTDLSPIVAHKMFWKAPSQLRQKIGADHTTDRRGLSPVIENAVQSGLIDGDSEQLVASVMKQLSKQGSGRVMDLLDHLQRKDLPRFQALMSALSGADKDTTERILKDPKGEALAIACRAIGAELTQFTNIFLQLDYLRFGQARPTGHIKNASDLYQLFDSERAQVSVNLWNLGGQVKVLDAKAVEALV